MILLRLCLQTVSSHVRPQVHAETSSLSQDAISWLYRLTSRLKFLNVATLQPPKGHDTVVDVMTLEGETPEKVITLYLRVVGRSYYLVLTYSLGGLRQSLQI